MARTSVSPVSGALASLAKWDVLNYRTGKWTEVGDVLHDETGPVPLPGTHDKTSRFAWIHTHLDS